MTAQAILRPPISHRAGARVVPLRDLAGLRASPVPEPQSRIAIVDGSPRSGEFETALRHAGYTVNHVAPGASTGPASVIIVDLLGGWSEAGLSAISERGASRTPRIALIEAAQASALARVDAGIDDFIVYPVRTAEAVARVERAIARSEAGKSSQAIEAGNVRLDPARFEVWQGDREVRLTFKEFELLRYLMTNRGNVVSREELVRNIWGYEMFGSYRTVDVQIRRVRVKLGDGDHSLIETVRPLGYRFKAEEPEAISLRSGA